MRRPSFITMITLAIAIVSILLSVLDVAMLRLSPVQVIGVDTGMNVLQLTTDKGYDIWHSD